MTYITSVLYLKDDLNNENTTSNILQSRMLCILGNYRRQYNRSLIAASTEVYACHFTMQHPHRL